MSHFTKVKTKMVAKEFVIKALQDLNYAYEEGNVQINGWMGQKKLVEIKVFTRNRDYDIGFSKSTDSYEIIADWWGISEIKKEQFAKEVYRRYAYHTTVSTLQNQGFSLVDEESESNGQIHLVLRRMV